MNMNYPTVKQAEQMLNEGVAQNPGKWHEHSLIAAECAGKIAESCGLDKIRAYINSLLHDIGRREGISNVRHVIDGYDYLMSQGFDGPARICLTHSFLMKNIGEYLGEIDITDDQKRFIEQFLANACYDDYDLLGQLCDYLSHPDGACIAQKRMVDVALRYGFNDNTLAKWRKALEIKAHFDELAGCDIYTLIL